MTILLHWGESDGFSCKSKDIEHWNTDTHVPAMAIWFKAN